MAAIWLVAVYLSAALGAFAALLVGLLAMSVYPISGVLATIGGMALLLHAAAGLSHMPELRALISPRRK